MLGWTLWLTIGKYYASAHTVPFTLSSGGTITAMLGGEFIQATITMIITATTTLALTIDMVATTIGRLGEIIIDSGEMIGMVEVVATTMAAEMVS